MNDTCRDEVAWKQNARFEEKEWSDGQSPRRCIFPLLLSAAPCSPAVTAAPLASASNTQVLLTSAARLGFFTLAAKFPLFKLFYKAGGVISGKCAKMSEHICWSKNVQTECVSGS